MNQGENLPQMAREIFSWSPHPAAFKRHMLYPLFFGICGGTLFLPSSPRSLMSRRKRVKKKKKKVTHYYDSSPPAVPKKAF